MTCFGQCNGGIWNTIKGLKGYWADFLMTSKENVSPKRMRDMWS